MIFLNGRIYGPINEEMIEDGIFISLSDYSVMDKHTVYIDRDSYFGPPVTWHLDFDGEVVRPSDPGGGNDGVLTLIPNGDPHEFLPTNVDECEEATGAWDSRVLQADDNYIYIQDRKFKVIIEDNVWGDNHGIHANCVEGQLTIYSARGDIIGLWSAENGLEILGTPFTRYNF